MNFLSLKSLLKKNKKKLTIPDSLLVKTLKKISLKNDIYLFKNVTIYHHASSYPVNLIMIDKLRGVYLFEIKEWTFNELKNANVQKAYKQESSKNTLAFENTQEIIRTKFNELTHNDKIEIYNYLLMENLNSNDYEQLNDSIKELLPHDKIIFSDSSQEDIIKKLHSATLENHNLDSINKIIGSLLVQYAIIDDENNIAVCTQEQINFIDKELEKLNFLNAEHSTGKTSTIILKAILEILNNPAKKITIIKSTLLACDIVKKKILDIIEHAIVDFDMTAIEVLTPLQLINKHQLKSNTNITYNISISKKLMNSSFKTADLIMCDDSHLYSKEFLDYIQHIQKNSQLLLVNSSQDTNEIIFTKSFNNKSRKVQFSKIKNYDEALQIVSKLLSAHEKKIAIVSDASTKEKIFAFLEVYLHENVSIIDSKLHLIDQLFSNVILCGYNDLDSLHIHHIILLDLASASQNEIEYAFNSSDKSVSVLYEENCENVNYLRSYYESSKK